MHCLLHTISAAFLAVLLVGQVSNLSYADTLPALPAPAEVRRLPHDGFVAALAFSPDANTLATASGDKFVRLWEVAGGKELRRFTGHKGSVLAVAVSRDGKNLATGSADNSVRLWNTASGAEVRRFQKHTYGVAAVAFHPDGQALVSAGNDGSDFQAVRQGPVLT
jgi:WD40 repeat protein